MTDFDIYKIIKSEVMVLILCVLQIDVGLGPGLPMGRPLPPTLLLSFSLPHTTLAGRHNDGPLVNCSYCSSNEGAEGGGGGLACVSGRARSKKVRHEM